MKYRMETERGSLGLRGRAEDGSRACKLECGADLCLLHSRCRYIDAHARSSRSVFLPAADIPRFVGEGNVDLGITGQDMVAEAGDHVSSLVTEELQLGFGKCKLQVQVPEVSGMTSAEELVGKKVATSFDFLAGKYFAELDERVNRTRIAEGKQKEGDQPLKTEIEYVGGSVEAACALGLADGIGEWEMRPDCDYETTRNKKESATRSRAGSVFVKRVA